MKRQQDTKRPAKNKNYIDNHNVHLLPLNVCRNIWWYLLGTFWQWNELNMMVSLATLLIPLKPYAATHDWCTVLMFSCSHPNTQRKSQPNFSLFLCKNVFYSSSRNWPRTGSCISQDCAGRSKYATHYVHGIFRSAGGTDAHYIQLCANSICSNHASNCIRLTSRCTGLDL